jgi:hypothetical protein
MIRQHFFFGLGTLSILLASCATPNSTVAVSTPEDDEIYLSKNERFITDPAPMSSSAPMGEEDYYTIPEESPLVDRQEEEGIVENRNWNDFNTSSGMMMSWNPWLGWHMSSGPMFNRYTSWSPWGNPFYDPFNQHGFGGWNNWNNSAFGWDTWGVMCPFGMNQWGMQPYGMYGNPWMGWNQWGGNAWAGNGWGGNGWGGNSWGGNAWAGNNPQMEGNGGGSVNMHRNPVATGSFVNSSFNNVEPRVRNKPVGVSGSNATDRPTIGGTQRERSPSGSSSPNTSPSRSSNEYDYFDGNSTRQPSTRPSNSNPSRGTQTPATQPASRDSNSPTRQVAPSSPSRTAPRTVAPSTSPSRDRSPSVSPSPSRGSGTSPSRSGGGTTGGSRRR